MCFNVAAFHGATVTRLPSPKSKVALTVDATKVVASLARAGFGEKVSVPVEGF